MVVNISKVLSVYWSYVEADIRELLQIPHQECQKVKVILENCNLNNEQKIRLYQICSDLLAFGVKKSTGYGTSGSTNEDLMHMQQHAAPHIQVKAESGILDLNALLGVRVIGLPRVWATAIATIMDESYRHERLEPIASSSPDAPAG